ncbi:MAG: hypothetical protein KatS3mg009_1876 [Acidimicrobiia bacterium]|nr:MAG: hypothetical protein KatS3mg009_1876 [Acidimicrobiia bacterium]
MGLRGVLGRLRERAAEPSGLPVWVVCGSAGAAALLLAAALAAGGSRLPLPAQAVLAAAAFAPWIPWGIRARSWAFVVATFGPVGALLAAGGSPVLFGLLALATARFAVHAPAVGGVAFAAAAVGCVGARHQWVGPTDWFVWKSYVELGLALGWAMRGQRLLVVRTEERARERARLAALEERRRIARDVHDTLAHTLTVMMVHLDAARLAVGDNPERATEALEELGALGRAGLVEVRRSVGLLSAPLPLDGPLDPTSAATAVEELVASFRRAGVDVDLRLDVDMTCMGRLGAAPVDLWRGAHRILQEALANAVRHAPGVPVRVRVDIDDAHVRLEVVNDRRAVVSPAVPGGGAGLQGMRERVAALGGSLEAGPAGPRWVVRAALPLGGRAPAALGGPRPARRRAS